MAFDLAAQAVAGLPMAEEVSAPAVTDASVKAVVESNKARGKVLLSTRSFARSLLLRPEDIRWK